MSEAENFLRRWSRRKADQATQPEPLPTEEASDKGELVAPIAQATSAAEAAAEFDPSSLPPVESIDAQSDIRAFLAPGVPVEMSRAALRQVWAADPAIRDFVGLAENSWDFNATGAVYGFDALKPAEIVELAKQFLRAQQPPQAEQPQPDDSAAPQTPEQVTALGAADNQGGEQPAVALNAATPHADVKAEDSMVHRDNAGTDVPKEAAKRHNPAHANARRHGRAVPT